MRVITGTARGRQLRTAPGEHTRPTTARVKEAIFSIIQFDIEGRRVLDLFAGTGQMGIEALSRGAGEVVFVDNSAEALSILRANLEHTGLSGGTIKACDAIAYLHRSQDPFDIVFLDPPYQSKLLLQALQTIESIDILRPGGIIICETGNDSVPPALSDPYVLDRTYRYGTQMVWLYRRQS